MAKNMTFSVSLKLLTKNFQNGIKSIQNSLGKLRQQFSTFVGGIGIGLGIQELIENAKSLDKAQATLKNVSGSMERYSENLKFVDDLSKKYNQDLIVLMGNFAKFYSAANYAGMSLKDQQHIYESLTRATTYFNLTADETNGVMLAVQQMISKGKVSSEELRRQLGERLPGAMNLAAKSMGMTTEELDKQIRLGNIYAKDLLPRLAAELNALTQNLDINTIQGLTNKVKNEFTEMVENMDVKGIYKKFLNAVAGGLEYIGNHLRQIGTAIAVVLETIVGKKMLQGGWNAWQNFFKKINSSLTESQTKLKIYKKELETLNKTNGVVYTTNTKTGRIGVNPKNNVGVDPKALNDAQIAAKAYNNELRKSAKLQGQLDNKWETIRKSIWKSVGNMVNFVGMQLVFTAISAALSLIITKTVQWFRKLNEVKRKAKEIKEELETDLNTVSPEQSKIDSLFLTGKETETERLRKIEEINRALGRTEETEFSIKNTNEEINAALQKRKDYLKEVNNLEAKNKALSEAQTLWNKQAGKNTTVEDLKKEKAELQKKINADKPKPNMNPQAYSYAMAAWSAGHIKDNARVSKIDQLLDLAQTIEDLKKEIADITTSDAYQNDGSGGNGGGGGLDAETLEKQYKKIQDEHNNKLRALNDRLNDNTISQSDYDKAVKELYFSTLENIYALDDINENTDPFAKSIKDAVKAYLSEVEAIRKTEEAIKEYNTKVQEAKNQFANGAITQTQLDEKLFELLQEVVLTISSFGNLNETAQELADAYVEAKKVESNRKANEIGSVDFLPPQAKSRDTSFDYKKTASEIAGENAELWRDEIKNLEELIKKYEELQKIEPTAKIQSYLDELNKKLQTATAEAETFEQAMKLATAQEDIKSLQKELRTGVWSNVKNIASSTDRLVKSFEEVSEVMNDPDASEWEKIIAHFNAFAQIVDTFSSLVQLFQQLNTVTEQLSAAQQGYQAIQEAGTAKTLMNAGSTIIAKEGEALAGGTASAAGLPFPANLIAIASIIGMIASIFASLPKFASGGVVGGNSPHGDKILARLNSGEVVLNKMQQASLWGMLNEKGTSGGSVSFELRGDKLQGVLNNYNKKTGKK